MELKKKGVLFMVAYGNRDVEKRPQCVGLWVFAVRFSWMLLVYWPVVGILTLLTLFLLLMSASLLGGVFFLILIILGFLFCHKPMLFRRGYGTFDFHPYGRWPTISGRRIYPFWVIVVLFSATYPERAKNAAICFFSVLADWTIFSKGFWIMEASVLLLLGLFALMRCSDEIGAIRNIKAFLLAHKQKYCPTLRVVE